MSFSINNRLFFLRRASNSLSSVLQLSLVLNEAVVEYCIIHLSNADGVNSYDWKFHEDKHFEKIPQYLKFWIKDGVDYLKKIATFIHSNPFQ